MSAKFSQSVIKGGANLDLLPANLHPRVREVITRCLQKDLKRRYSSITDARYEIEQALADPSGVLVQPVTAAEPRRKLRTILPWVAAALVLHCDHCRSGCLETEAAPNRVRSCVLNTTAGGPEIQ